MKSRGGPVFSFLDGPVTANNPLGVHHAWGRTHKDVVQRFMILTGHELRLQNGFDCHGLWVEVEVEKSLGFRNKEQVADLGVGVFNQYCKERVLHFARVQTEQSRRLGQMMDWEQSYYTMSQENMNLIWYFLKQCHDKGLLYRGKRVLPWCVRCQTSLSSHEVAGSYAEKRHVSVHLLFPSANKYFLVWTTTPWSVLANVALAVNPQLEYGEFTNGQETLVAGVWLSDSLLSDWKLVRTFSGSELVGERYTHPLSGSSNRVVPWKRVTEEGSGIVHVATGCGPEDYALVKDRGLPLVELLDGDGGVLQGYGRYSGLFYREVTGPLLEELDSKGLLFSEKPLVHNYPVCWRCKTDLVYRVSEEWFLACTSLRQNLLDVAQDVVWDPPFLANLFSNWVRNMDDWCLSRKRYWGVPLPFFPCQCGDLMVFESKEELEEVLGTELPDMHRPDVDLSVPCDVCGGMVARVTEVGDCWLDAGAVPFSTLMYLEDRSKWSKWFPADLVCEMKEQTRLWFYSCMVFSVVLEGVPPFRYVLGYDKVKSRDGREMHKSGANSVSLDHVLDEVGADVLRLLFLSQPRDRPLHFDLGATRQHSRLLRRLYNVAKFLFTYEDLDGWTRKNESFRLSLLDEWLLSRRRKFVSDMRSHYLTYKFNLAVSTLDEYVDDLSNWYVRRSRRRVWTEANTSDKSTVYGLLFDTLKELAVVVSPMVPFFSEALFQRLSRYSVMEASVFFSKFPYALDLGPDDVENLRAMDDVRRLVTSALRLRERAQLKLRQPLQELLLWSQNKKFLLDLYRYFPLLREELNVKRVRVVDNLEWYLKYELRPNYRRLSEKYGAESKLFVSAVNRLSMCEVRKWVSGEEVTARYRGQSYPLSEEFVHVKLHWRDGFDGVMDGDLAVVLKTKLTDSLRFEGAVKELKRRLQLERKRVGLRLGCVATLELSSSHGVQEFLGPFLAELSADVALKEIRFRADRTGMSEFRHEVFSIHFSLHHASSCEVHLQNT